MRAHRRGGRRLHAVLDGTRHGRGAALVVRAEPGAGKTTLLRLARRQARDLDVLSVSGFPQETGLPFAGLYALLEPVRADLARLPGPQRDAIGGVLGLVDPRSGSPLLVHAACLSLLAARAARRPLLVLVDDAHLLDPESAAALCFVARHVEGRPMAVLMAVDDTPDVRLDLTGLEVMELDGLSQDEAARLLTGHRRCTAAPVAEELWRATGGNAAELRHLAERLTDEELRGLVPLPEWLPLGGPLALTFRDRIARLPASTRLAVLAVAVARRSDLAVVVVALDALGVDVDELGEAAEAGLVHVHFDEVVPCHPLLGPVARAEAPMSQLRAAHQALARAGHPADRWWHLAGAAVGTDPEAARLLTDVAHRASANGEFRKAAGVYRRAAQLAGAPTSRCVALCSAALAEAHAGRPESALALIDDALGWAEDANARSALRGVRGLALAVGGELRAAAALLEDEARLVADHGPAEASLLEQTAVVRLLTGEPEAGRRLAEQAHGLVSGTKSRVAVESAALLALCSGLRGRRAAAQGMLTDPVLDHDLWRDAPWELEAAILTAASSLVVEDHDRAEHLLRRCVDRFRPDGVAALPSLALLLLSTLELRTGHWEAAASGATRALRACRGQPTFSAHAHAVMARVEALRGHDGPCVDHALAAVRIATRLEEWLVVPIALYAQGSLALGRGDSEGAVSHLRDVQELVLGQGIEDPRAVPWAPDLVEAYAHAGRLKGAEEVLEVLDRQARATGSAWASAAVLRGRGLLADAGFEELFETALEVQRGGDSPFEVARTELAFGQRLRRARHRADARQRLRSAHAGFRRLGAGGWARMCARELELCGDTGRRRLPSDPSTLTVQEQRVAELVAGGASNREVAAVLFLSPRTVENHLSRVYAKLGIRTRTQLAAHPSAGQRRS